MISIFEFPIEILKYHINIYLTVNDIIKIDSICLCHKFRYQWLKSIENMIILNQIYNNNNNDNNDNIDNDNNFNYNCKDLEFSIYFLRWLVIRRIYILSMKFDCFDGMIIDGGDNDHLILESSRLRYYADVIEDDADADHYADNADDDEYVDNEDDTVDDNGSSTDDDDDDADNGNIFLIQNDEINHAWKLADQLSYMNPFKYVQHIEIHDSSSTLQSSSSLTSLSSSSLNKILNLLSKHCKNNQLLSLHVNIIYHSHQHHHHHNTLNFLFKNVVIFFNILILQTFH